MRSFQRKKPKMTASFMLTAVEEGVCVTEREREGGGRDGGGGGGGGGGCSSSSSSWFMSLV